MSEHRREEEGEVVTEDDTRIEEPPMYRVLLLNDDFTPMDFVVMILRRIFHFPEAEAVRIMLAVHHQGSGDCGLFPYEVARTKVFHVQSLAKEHGHPLQCTYERAD
ncbi:MAG: ATP-dependent Clp protease adaptor ClpS [Deltaproteobacteria bacterium RIFOXYA12_FULL_61_11]|nr:MAG: ATP-dependent Clp protease adaptor ClpS [Deltaproteobacteria bacterium RIFOXYA12_FULL_61_11]